MDFPDNTFLLKALTVVSGPDMVDLTFHNFVSCKENVSKVRRGPRPGAWPWHSRDFLRHRPGPRGGVHTLKVEGLTAVLWSRRTGLKIYWLWPSTR